MYTTQKVFHRRTFSALALAVLAIGTTNMFAAAIPTTDGGILQLVNFTGSLVGVTTAPSPCINWSGGATCPVGGTAEVTVGGASADFSTVASTADKIKDLTGYGSVVGFQTIVGGSKVGGATVHFDLTSVVLTGGGAGYGNCTSNAPMNSCSPVGSPFSFTEDITGTQVTISFSVFLNAYTGSSSNGFTPYVGIFTTHQSGTLVGAGACAGLTANITNILSCQGAKGTIDATWAASESPYGKPFTGCTYTQGGWGSKPAGNNPGSILKAAFPTVYPTGVEIGGAVPLNDLLFTSALAVQNFLPQGGPPTFLNSSATNPTSSSAGVFAGEVLALALNVGVNGYGNAIVSGTGTPFDGQTVSAVLAAANEALGKGGLPPGFASFSALNNLIDNLNSQYDNCGCN